MSNFLRRELGLKAGNNIMGAQPQADYLRWLVRVSDDMWGAVQLLGLFFLGATILCVPPRFGGPSAGAPYLSAAQGTDHASARVVSIPALTPAGVRVVPLTDRTAGSIQITDESGSITVSPPPAQ